MRICEANVLYAISLRSLSAQVSCIQSCAVAPQARLMCARAPHAGQGTSEKQASRLTQDLFRSREGLSMGCEQQNASEGNLADT